MESVNEVVRGILDNAEIQAPRRDNEFLASDGLLHCAECGDAVQCRIMIFGQQKVVRCICSCTAAEMKAEEDRRRADLIESNRRTCFEGSDMIGWKFSADDEKDLRLSNAMRRYVASFDEFKRSGKGLLLYGRNGTGKTFYACCIANSLIDEGFQCLVTNFARLSNQLSAVKDKQAFIDSLSSFSLLVLDDLGAERQSEYMQEQVFNIVNARYCSGLPFIVTTNLTIEEITKPQDMGRARIYNRILERCYPVSVNSFDRRKAQLKYDYPTIGSKLGLSG